MGVHKLWEVLKKEKSVKKDVTLQEMSGLTLAVDLAPWICSAENVKTEYENFENLFLRILFYRIAAAMKVGITLIFVLDGKAPDLKVKTIVQRLNNRGSPCKSHDGNRTFLDGKFDQCCQLLDAFGVPWIKAEGEAEAFCSALNKCGVVDGVISDDSDCFLYGARRVFRHFLVDKSKKSIESYLADDIQKTLNLNQQKFIALGLLLGCDYYKGIKGYGPVNAKKLLSEWGGDDPLDKLSSWIASEKEKRDQNNNFPDDTIIKDCIKEYLDAKRYDGQDVGMTELSHLKEKLVGRPLMLDTACEYLQSGVFRKLSMQEIVQKVLPIVTRLWLNRPADSTEVKQLELRRIVKKRQLNKTQCFEVEWILTEAVSLCLPADMKLTTVEPQDDVRKAYHDVVASYESEQIKKSPAKKRGAKRSKATSKKMTEYYSAKKNRKLSPDAKA